MDWHYLIPLGNLVAFCIGDGRIKVYKCILFLVVVPTPIGVVWHLLIASAATEHYVFADSFAGDDRKDYNTDAGSGTVVRIEVIDTMWLGLWTFGANMRGDSLGSRWS